MLSFLPSLLSCPYAFPACVADAGPITYQQVFQPDPNCSYGPSAPSTPMAPATPHAGCDFGMQYQLITPIPMGAGMPFGMFAEPPGQHSPEAAGLAQRELTQLAELLGQAAALPTDDVPQQVRGFPPASARGSYRKG